MRNKASESVGVAIDPVDHPRAVTGTESMDACRVDDSVARCQEIQRQQNIIEGLATTQKTGRTSVDTKR
jgi:hypothetical protein